MSLSILTIVCVCLSVLCLRVAHTEQIRNQFVELMDEVECWLYDEGFSATVEQYKDKLNTLKGYGSPILERFEEKQNRGDAIGLLQQKIGDARAWMTTTVSCAVLLLFLWFLSLLLLPYPPLT